MGAEDEGSEADKKVSIRAFMVGCDFSEKGCSADVLKRCSKKSEPRKWRKRCHLF